MRGDYVLASRSGSRTPQTDILFSIALLAYFVIDFLCFCYFNSITLSSCCWLANMGILTSMMFTLQYSCVHSYNDLYSDNIRGRF